MHGDYCGPFSTKASFFKQIITVFVAKVNHQDALSLCLVEEAAADVEGVRRGGESTSR